MKKLLSIIIVSFNSKEFLESCLESLEKSTIQNQTELIVIDNASTDGSVEYLTNRFRNVNFISNKNNTGFAKANNQGIKLSSGKYILLLNPDTIVPADTLPVMVDFMESHHSAGVSTCFIRLTNGKIDDACHRGFPTPWNSLCHFSGLASLFPGSRFFNGYHLGYKNLDKVHEIDSCTGAFLMIRRTVGEKLNWLDTDYFWYGEDLDFCYRVKEIGYSVFFVPKVSITHYKGISSGIKKHSEEQSKASYETKLKATVARFAVMKTFYNKHYMNTGHRFLWPLVLAGINLKKKLTLLKLKSDHHENRI